MLNIKKKLQKYFKLTFYKIYKIIYGEIKGKISHLEDDDIKLSKVKIDNNLYKVFKCLNCSLYTDRIHDTAIIKHNKIIDGPSFQLRYNINEECSKNSVFKNGTPRLRKKINGSVFSLLTGGGGNSNYWHWLFDVLPRLKIYENLSEKNNPVDYYLFPNLHKNFQKETLDFLKIKTDKRLSSKAYRHLSADQIIATTHPYTLLNNPNIDSLQIPSWIFNYLRSQFLEKALQNSKLKKYPKKIYINRKDATSLRYIINENEVENFLINDDFTSITLSEYSFSDQVALFHNANKIIGLHGAGFANIIFCKAKTKIIEMRSTTTGDVIKNLALKNNLIYLDITCNTQSINLNNQEGDIEIKLRILNEKLSQ